MFITTTGEKSPQISKNSIYFNDFDESGNLSLQYTINAPFRLLGVCMNPENTEMYFSTTYLTPNGCMHSALSKHEANDLLLANLHKHDFFELMFVMDGEIYQNIEHNRHLYTKGSLCILNKNVRHTEEYNSNFRIVFLQLRQDFLKNIFEDLQLDLFHQFHDASPLMDFLHMNLSENNLQTKDYLDFIPSEQSDFFVESIHTYFDIIGKETLSPSSQSSLRIKRTVEDIFHILSLPEKFSTVPVQIGGDLENELFEKISDFMRKTNGRISRSQLANALNYSGAYLNEVCKKYSGLSLFDYGMTFCMKEAARLLTASKEKITDISDTLGFTNRSHFYKIFEKTYGCTPAQYRKQPNP